MVYRLSKHGSGVDGGRGEITKASYDGLAWIYFAAVVVRLRPIPERRGVKIGKFTSPAGVAYTPSI